MLPIITVFGFDIPMYPICSFAGIAIMVLFCVMQCRRARRGAAAVQLQDMFFMLLYACIGLVIGAKLMYIIVSVDVYWYPEYSLADNLQYWMWILSGGGLVFYGGLIGAFAGAFIYIMQFKTPISEMLDIGFSGVPLFHTFGRIGCFMAGCCYGIEYHGSFSVVFGENNLGGAPAGVELLPVQLIEAGCDLLLWAVLFAVYRRTSRRWLISGLYLVSYGVIRFILEFFRGDLIRGQVSVLSTSQFISIFIVAVGILLLIRPKWLDRFGSRNDKSYAQTS